MRSSGSPGRGWRRTSPPCASSAPCWPPNGASRRRRARRGASPDRARDPRRDLQAPVRPADDRRRDAQGRSGQPAGPRDRAHQRGGAARHAGAADRAAPGQPGTVPGSPRPCGRSARPTGTGSASPSRQPGRRNRPCAGRARPAVHHPGGMRQCRPARQRPPACRVDDPPGRARRGCRPRHRHRLRPGRPWVGAPRNRW